MPDAIVKTLSIFCAFVASNIQTAAVAQVGLPTRAEISVLRACIDTIEPERIYPGCFGTLRKHCVMRVGDGTQVTEANCVSYEKAAWTQILQETVRSVGGDSNPSIQRAQAAWNASQLASRRAVLNAFEGGNAAGMYADLAESKEIAKRVQFFYEHFQ
jgi:hypothetical protein